MKNHNLFCQLEKTKPTDKKNQTEDYFTKILQFILLNNSDIRREFLRWLFKKQPPLIRKYCGLIKSASEMDVLSHTTSSEGIPDLLIGNERTPRLAVEIKLESTEGRAQIMRYLKNNDLVAYISLHHENLSKKYEDNPKYLGSFRWHEFYHRIEKYRKNDRITKHFIEYMEIKEMNMKLPLSKDDINEWKKYEQLERKMREYSKKLVKILEGRKEINKARIWKGSHYKGVRFVIKKGKYHGFNRIYFFAGFHNSNPNLSFSVELNIPKSYWHCSEGLESRVPIEENNNGKIYRYSSWFVISKPIEKVIDISSGDDVKQLRQMSSFIDKSIKQFKECKYLREYFTKGW